MIQISAPDRDGVVIDGEVDGRPFHVLRVAEDRHVRITIGAQACGWFVDGVSVLMRRAYDPEPAWSADVSQLVPFAELPWPVTVTTVRGVLTVTVACPPDVRLSVTYHPVSECVL